jgi:hypothetical protein
MAGAVEASFAKTPLGADLDVGVAAISYDQSVTFTLYKRLVLPLDGFIFWVRADLLMPSSLFNVRSTFNAAQFNQPAYIPTTAPTFNALGSLHFSTETRQVEDATYVANRMVFTAREEVSQLNAIEPNTMWIATFLDGTNQKVQFSFSGRSIWYKQAGLWHYTGYAVYPDMTTQVVDDVASLNTRDVIVSDSLPAWLGLNGYVAQYSALFSNPSLVLYPSFLTPTNIEPPYATVHIFPESTVGLQMAPLLDQNYSHFQLCSDRVRITLWGTRNSDALTFIDVVNQYTLDTGLFGLMNIPVMRDEKRIQQELGTIAMKKTVEYQISYQQSTIRQFAQNYIRSSIINYIIPGIVPSGGLPDGSIVTDSGAGIVTDSGAQIVVG